MIKAIPLEPSINSSPASSAREFRTECTPSTLGNELDHVSLDAIETIDLTGKVALPSPSTTDWEPPRPRADGAVPPECCRAKRGKKRKGGECTPDLLATSGTPSKFQHLSRAGTSPPVKNIPAELSATPSRRSTPSDAMLHKTSIADEDNDNDSPDTWLDIDTIFPDAGLELYPQPPRSTYRGERKTESPQQPNSPLYSNDATPPPPCIEWNSNSSQSHNPESLPITKMSTIKQADKSFKGFLAVHSETLAQLISILKEKLHKNAEIIYEQAIQGRLAPDIIAANRDLVSQIQIMETLQTSRSAYQDCATRKEDLKQSLMRVISEGSDPTTMPEMAQSRLFEAEMRKTEAQIRELLPRAKIFDIACNFETNQEDTICE
ncbi:Bloom syndrome protein [Penicillium nucicola]|uniref:Bloom syndrome protein n=1 Tax=Penicillium nucicola TaxID=1850975 RepID=UPI002545B15A|nr:Bloom syndrome protein [Penicillium nucicola]KAJ5742382.1 Bloom syndrome protein [Penicillium nucicola]